MINPIVEEVRKAGEEYAARFNYDLDAMVRDLREQAMNRRLKISGEGRTPVIPSGTKTAGPTAALPPRQDNPAVVG